MKNLTRIFSVVLDLWITMALLAAREFYTDATKWEDVSTSSKSLRSTDVSVMENSPLFNRVITLENPFEEDSRFGGYISGGGDLDGDGYGDLVVSADSADSHSGKVVVYYGPSFSRQEIIKQTDRVNSYFGRTCCIIPDMNGNKSDDILITQIWSGKKILDWLGWKEPPLKQQWGLTYVIDGKTHTVISIIQNEWSAAYSSMPIGDIDLDGIIDIGVTESTIVDDSKSVLMQMGNRWSIYSGKSFTKN